MMLRVVLLPREKEMRFAIASALSALITLCSFPGLAFESWDEFRVHVGTYTETVAISDQFALVLSDSASLPILCAKISVSDIVG
jgi:hypothetical protein